MGKHDGWIFAEGDRFRIKGVAGKDGRRTIKRDVFGELYAEDGGTGQCYDISDHAKVYRENGHHFRRAATEKPWVFADGDRFRYPEGRNGDGGLTSDVRVVSARPEAIGSDNNVINRGESDFLVVDEEGNYAGRLPQDAAMYRAGGRHFRRHPERAYYAPGTAPMAPTIAPPKAGHYENVPGTEGGLEFKTQPNPRWTVHPPDGVKTAEIWLNGAKIGEWPVKGPISVVYRDTYENPQEGITWQRIPEPALAEAERVTINGVEFVRADTVKPFTVPIEIVDGRLTEVLIDAGNVWGPAGVASAAAQLAGWIGPL